VAFTVLSLTHAPDADKSRHRSIIDTGKYRLITVVVRNQAEALEVCRELALREPLDSVLLCPGFTHGDIAEIAAAVGDKVGVSVARGDGPSNRISMGAMEREGYWRGSE
jgi:hypothetical protein